ncbi:hypothetical protein B296_00033474, partial [Ensete ventricosum]
SKGRVCVTGASGYVASWLIKRLLQSGYHVIGTVRDPGDHKKLAHLWELVGAKDRLQLVKANLMEEGSFDDAVMECEGVFHTASPVVVVANSNVLDNHEVAAQLANRYPSLPIPNRFHNYCAEIPRYQFDTSKLRDLGFKFKGIEEMFDDCITSLRTQGYQI